MRIPVVLGLRLALFASSMHHIVATLFVVSSDDLIGQFLSILFCASKCIRKFSEFNRILSHTVLAAVVQHICAVD